MSFIIFFTQLMVITGIVFISVILNNSIVNIINQIIFNFFVMFDSIYYSKKLNYAVLN
jgi:hypothetical protein